MENNATITLSKDVKSVKEASTWLDEMTKKYKMSLTSFNVYRQSEKFNEKTGKWKKVKPYFEASIHLSNKV